MRRFLLLSILFCCLLALAACSKRWQPRADAVGEPVLEATHAIMDDGYRLPVSAWHPEGDARAVVLAVHGFNDYRRAFAGAGEYLAARGIATYAYDQRGFGETAHRGLWPGHRRLAADLRAMAALLRQRHPAQPLFLLGESMGGAVAIVAVGGELAVDGVVLSAPAVWSRDSMPWYQRLGLWLAVRLMPGWAPTGESLGRLASNNLEMLRELARDPLVIKHTRMDTIAGLVDLMDAAAAGAARLEVRTLILYGAHDEIIPPQPTCRLLRRQPPTADWRFTYYPDGYHMLLRDLQGERVLSDIAGWLLDADALAAVPAINGKAGRRLVCTR